MKQLSIKLISLFLILTISSIDFTAYSKEKVIKVTAEPAEAAIYIDNVLSGYGFAEFAAPKKKNSVVVIKIECEGYKTLNTRYYGADKRESLAFRLQQDGFVAGSVASGVVNKFFTIEVAPQYYTKKGDGSYDTSSAWKMLHQILLNYFDEIETTDFYSGFVQTPWHYSRFTLSDRQIRNRVTIRDISTPERVAFQIKISSEVAGVLTGKHNEFTEIDRIPKDFEPLIQELQTRIGKLFNL